MQDFLQGGLTASEPLIWSLFILAVVTAAAAAWPAGRVLRTTAGQGEFKLHALGADRPALARLAPLHDLASVPSGAFFRLIYFRHSTPSGHMDSGEIPFGPS